MPNCSLYSFKSWHLFICYFLFYGAINLLSYNYIFTDSYTYSILQNQLSSNRIADIIKINSGFWWVSYLLIPILLLIKWLLVTVIVYIGIHLFNHSISFENCFKIIVLAEVAMAAAALIKAIWFLIQRPDTLQGLQLFYPLSLIQLFSVKQIPFYFIYPLQQINIFELAYWILISLGIQTFIQKPFLQSFKITASSYGIGLFIWVLLFVFFQLQFS